LERCTFFPNNISPDGSITKALEGLTSLSAELAENSTTNDPFTGMIEKWLGRWTTCFSTAISVCCSSHASHLWLLLYPMLEGTVPKTDWDHPYHRTMYQQVESDDDYKLREDDGDEDADNV